MARGVRRQGAADEGKNLRRGERRRPIASGARLGGFDRPSQRPVICDPQDRGGGVERRTPLPCRVRGQFPPDEQMLARRPGVGARPGEVDRVAQARLVLGPAGPRNAGGGGGKRQPPAENAGPGRIFAHDRVEAGERRAGEKGGLGLAFRWIFPARPRRESRRRGRRKAFGFPANQRGRACGKGYLAAALLASFDPANRRACQLIGNVPEGCIISQLYIDVCQMFYRHSRLRGTLRRLANLCRISSQYGRRIKHGRWSACRLNLVIEFSISECSRSTRNIPQARYLPCPSSLADRARPPDLARRAASL